MVPIARIFLVMLITQTICGCATLFNGKHKKLEINSEPPGASVDIGNGLAKCVTPCNIELVPKQSYPIIVKLDGHETYKAEIKRRPSALFWVNFSALIYGTPGLLIDWLTGRMWVWRKVNVIKLKEGEDEEEEPEAPPPPPPPPPPSLPPPSLPPPSLPPPVVVKSDLPTVANTVKKPEPGSIQEKYPEELVKRRLEWFFGPQKAKRLDEMVSCTYYELQRDEGGTELSLDDGVKMAHDQHESSCP